MITLKAYKELKHFLSETVVRVFVLYALQYLSWQIAILVEGGRMEALERRVNLQYFERMNARMEELANRMKRVETAFKANHVREERRTSTPNRYNIDFIQASMKVEDYHEETDLRRILSNFKQAYATYEKDLQQIQNEKECTKRKGEIKCDKRKCELDMSEEKNAIMCEKEAKNTKEKEKHLEQVREKECFDAKESEVIPNNLNPSLPIVSKSLLQKHVLLEETSSGGLILYPLVPNQKSYTKEMKQLQRQVMLLLANRVLNKSAGVKIRGRIFLRNGGMMGSWLGTCKRWSNLFQRVFHTNWKDPDSLDRSERCPISDVIEAFFEFVVFMKIEEDILSFLECTRSSKSEFV